MMTSLFAGDSRVLAGIDLQGRTKREAAREVVSRLQRDERRFQSLTVGVLMTLADYDAGFKHLARMEDGTDKLHAAQNALAEIKRVIGSTRSSSKTVPPGRPRTLQPQPLLPRPGPAHKTSKH